MPVTEREERVRQRAQQLWKQAGTPEGRDDEFWHQAEAELDAEAQQQPTQPHGRR
jgi:hypothetical protein